MSCFHCNSIIYIYLKRFGLNLIDHVRENQCLLVNTIKSLVGVFAKDKVFQKN